MRQSKQVGAGLLLLAGLAASGCGGAPHQAAGQAGDTAPVAAQQAPLTGTPPCSGRGCHGALEPAGAAEPPSRSSFARWQADDPHAGAYRALLTPLARQVAERPGIKNVAEHPPCLACHTNPRAAGDHDWARQSGCSASAAKRVTARPGVAGAPPRQILAATVGRCQTQAV